MSISFENPIVGDIGGDQEDSLGASPPQKKHKLDDKECHGAKEKEKEMPTSEKDSCCSNEIFTISDEQFEKLKLDYCPEGVEEIDQDVWTKYFKEIEESEGFDIYHYPGLCLMARFTPLDVDNFSSDMAELSKAAIVHFNKEKIKNYKWEKVETANAQLCGAGVNYYITFQAKDFVTNAFDTFQALVWNGWNPESIDVQFCRLKSVPAT